MPIPFRAAMQAGDHDALVCALPHLEYTLDREGDPHVLGFRATIDGVPIEGLDLLTHDEAGKVSEIKVFFRPFRGVAKFLDVTGPRLARRRRGRGAAAAMRMAGPPLSGMMRTAASTGPKILALKSAQRKP